MSSNLSSGVPTTHFCTISGWRFLLLMASAALLVSTSTATAGEPTVELTEEQLKLNNKAIQALQEDPPDTEAAIRFAKAALLVGPPGNVLHLTLGRAHQLAGQCDEAHQAFRQALDAQAVEGVSIEQVSARIARYRRQVETSCPGALVIECNNPHIELQLGDRAITCDEAVDIDAGQYILEARLGHRTATIDIEIIGMERVQEEISLGHDWEAITDAFARATAAVGKASSHGDRSQDRAFRRLEDERLEAQRQQLAAEREQLEASQNTQQQASPERDDDGPDDPSPATQQANERDAPLGWHGQTGILAQVGGYAIQSRDGAVDGGMLYGGSATSSIGYGFSRLIAVEHHLQFDYGQGQALGFKVIDGHEDEHNIGLRTWRLLNEVKTWLTFFGGGLFFDYRSQSLDFPTSEHRSGTLMGGPMLAISSTSVDRDEGYIMLSGRWAPLIDGDNQLFSVQISGGSSYALFALEYSKLYGASLDHGALRRGEVLSLNIGFRIPYTF